MSIFHPFPKNVSVFATNVPQCELLLKDMKKIREELKPTYDTPPIPISIAELDKNLNAYPLTSPEI